MWRGLAFALTPDNPEYAILADNRRKQGRHGDGVNTVGLVHVQNL